ncbi:DUF2637 domain-containing protein [Streptomyces antimicrobicus]|uniref:DUF2637 domain-containing protein n=1 Tax=Streptomyces antimicrobicus TaxID=2883108 RepID=A0ABS8BDZ6_9ACTN|nr:DUF2637 domain-containing protein [Streptomyces antimicrobicus]MCB5182867.1 DUF2637 domain-containing protein [Streptomyces antimicrobicus]
MLDSRPDVADAPGSPPYAAESTTDRPGSTTAPRPSRTPRVDRWLMPTLYVIAALGGLLVGGIGFAGSYETLRAAAITWHFSPAIADWFPIAVDGAIVAFLVMDLVLTKRGIPWPFLRLAGHGMTAVTIVLNGRAHGGAVLSTETLAHGVMPFLFSVGAESARRLVVQAARLAAGHQSTGVPFHRWLLALPATFKLWRRMKLWELRSYDQAVTMDQEREIYAARLEQQYGKNWRKVAKADEMLPFRMAPFGLSVAEALAIPEKEAEAARLEEQAKKDQAVADQAADEERQARAKLAATEAQIKTLEAEARLAEQQAILQARTATTAAKAGAEVATAEAAAAAQAEAAVKAAEAAATAQEDEATAAALRKTAEHRRATADANKAAADAEAAAADSARRAADDRKRAADIDRAAAAQELAAAADRKRAADIDRAAADAKRAAVDAENAALDAEAVMKLNPTDRAARLVARVVLRDFGGDAEAMPMETVQEVLGGASHGTAVKRRAEAAQWIADGYRG